MRFNSLTEVAYGFSGDKHTVEISHKQNDLIHKTPHGVIILHSKYCHVSQSKHAKEKVKVVSMHMWGRH